MLRASLKSGLHLVCQVVVAPLGILCWLEKHAPGSESEGVFGFCAQLLAVFPGLPGAFLRRAFYSLTLDHCSAHCHIGFGTLFSHRNVNVGDFAYIGNYALIGSADIGAHALIGSRVSILSGASLHERDENGGWTSYAPERRETVHVGAHVWIGEAAVISADVGAGSMVGAGAVVTSAVREAVVVTGNPARFVRRLDVDATSAE
ncbi:MAG: acyltransferase [Pseudomonadota bacterium]